MCALVRRKLLEGPLFTPTKVWVNRGGVADHDTRAEPFVLRYIEQLPQVQMRAFAVRKYSASVSRSSRSVVYLLHR